MRFLSIALTLLMLETANGQNRLYERIQLVPDRTEFKLEDISVSQTYSLNDLKFHFGHITKPTITEFGPKMIVKDIHRNKVFENRAQDDSYFLRPNFFKTNDPNDPVLLFTEMGSEYSWGNLLFTIQNRKIEQVGHLNIAVLNSYSEEVNIIPDIKIVSDGETIRINFLPKEVIYNPGRQDQRTVRSKDIWYELQNGELTLYQN